MDFTGLDVVREGESLSDRDLTRALRLSVAAEHDAIHLYELIADSVDNPQIQKLFQDVANEEKVHVGEFKKVLNILDSSNELFEEKGFSEATEIVGNKKEDRMQKSKLMSELIKLADTLDTKGLVEEADTIDSIVKEAWVLVPEEELNQIDQEIKKLDLRKRTILDQLEAERAAEPALKFPEANSKVQKITTN